MFNLKNTLFIVGLLHIEFIRGTGIAFVYVSQVSFNLEFLSLSLSLACMSLCV